MLRDFKKDLENARGAELLTLSLLESLTNDYEFFDMTQDRSWRYKGDIKAVCKATGKVIGIDVKDDSRIAETRNILCEEESYIKEYDYFIKGSMQSDYDVIAIVSQPERKIYFIDFEILKQNYKKGEFRVIRHYDQDTYCYLLAIGIIKKRGGLIATIEY